MNVASKDLCETLHELSGWDDTEKFSRFGVVYANGEYEDYGMSYEFGQHVDDVPAYDLGYLLRKLPLNITPGDGVIYRIEVSPQGFVNQSSHPKWCAAYGSQGHAYGVLYVAVGDTPEDATAMLAIELFKQVVLKREDQ